MVRSKWQQHTWAWWALQNSAAWGGGASRRKRKTLPAWRAWQASGGRLDHEINANGAYQHVRAAARGEGRGDGVTGGRRQSIT